MVICQGNYRGESYLGWEIEQDMRELVIRHSWNFGLKETKILEVS